MFHIKVVHLFGILEKESNYTKYASCLLSQKKKNNSQVCPKLVYYYPERPKLPFEITAFSIACFKIQKMYNVRSTVASSFVEAGANRSTTD